jgi:FHS family glucose/mannose:H+ symporter-like MFS transporter
MTGKTTLTWHMSAFAVGAFLLLGMLYSILGPALPQLSERFGLRATGASALLSLNSAGALVGVLVAGSLASRTSARRRSMAGVSVLALGCVGLALAPNFALALLAVALLGFGFGMLDLTINVWLSTGFGDRSAAAINQLSASFGVGAVLAPLAVGLASSDFRLPLLGCSVLAAALILALLALPPQTPQQISGPQPPQAQTGQSRLLVGFVLFFLAYVAVEGGVSGWEVTHLQDALRIGTGTAAALSSLFWVAFALGRLVAAPLALKVAPPRLVVGALALAVASLALAMRPTLAPIGYALTGFFLAPVFTTGLVWLTRVLPVGAPPTIVFAGGFLGPVLFSPIVGALSDVMGSAAIPVTLLGIAVLSLAMAIGLARATTKFLPD